MKRGLSVQKHINIIMNDETGLISAYQKIYGEKNSPEQINEALENAQDDVPKKHHRRRRRKNKQIISENKQTNVGQTSNNIGEKKDMSKSKFNKLFEAVYSEQFEDEMLGGEELGAEEGLPEGEELGNEMEEVTVTLPRELAEKLFEVLSGAIEAEGEEGEEEGEEDLEGDFGDDFEETEEPGLGESAESNTQKLGDEKGMKLTKGNTINMPKAAGDGPFPHASGRGAQASQRPHTPKAAPKNYGG